MEIAVKISSWYFSQSFEHFDHLLSFKNQVTKPVVADAFFQLVGE
jgi:hypothetical protein